MRGGNGFEKDMLVVEVKERRSEDGVHPQVGEPNGRGNGGRGIHAPEFHMVGERQGEGEFPAAGRPGQEFGAQVGRQALDAAGLARGHVEQFEAVEIILAGLAEVARVHAQAGDTGLARGELGDGHLAAGAVAHHGLGVIPVEYDGRQRAGQRKFFDFLGRVAEAVRHGGQAAGQQKGRRHHKHFLGHEVKRNYCLQM